MILVRRLLLTLAAVLVVLVGAAAAEAANPVVAAAKRTADARSSVFDMQMTVEASGTSIAIAASGAMRGQDSAKMTMSTSGGGVNAAIDMLLLREAGRLVMYMRRRPSARRSPGEDMDAPRPRSLRGEARPRLSSSSRRRRTLGPLERGNVSTTRSGLPRWPASPTTRYRVVIGEASDQGGPRLREASSTRSSGHVSRLPRLTEDVWIGRDGRIRRVGLSYPFVQQGVRATSSMTMTFRAYDVPVSISAPPRAQVFDFS